MPQVSIIIPIYNVYRRLEHYFLTEGFVEEAATLVSLLKIAFKEVLLRSPEKEYVRMWKTYALIKGARIYSLFRLCCV